MKSNHLILILSTALLLAAPSCNRDDETSSGKDSDNVLAPDTLNREAGAGTSGSGGSTGMGTSNRPDATGGGSGSSGNSGTSGMGSSGPTGGAGGTTGAGGNGSGTGTGGQGTGSGAESASPGNGSGTDGGTGSTGTAPGENPNDSVPDSLPGR